MAPSTFNFPRSFRHAAWLALCALLACQADPEDPKDEPTYAAAVSCGQSCEQQCAVSCFGVDEAACDACVTGPFCAPPCQCEQGCPIPELPTCKSCQVVECTNGQRYGADSCNLLAKKCTCGPEVQPRPENGCLCSFWSCDGQTLGEDVWCAPVQAEDCALCGSDLTCLFPQQEICEPLGCSKQPIPNCVEPAECLWVTASCAGCQACRDNCTENECPPEEPEEPEEPMEPEQPPEEPQEPMEPEQPPPASDELDQSARRVVTSLRRLGPDGNAETKQLTRQTLDQVMEIVDRLPSDLELKPDTDLRPHIATLGRAWSTLTLINTLPIGKLPNGRLCPDLLEGTKTDPNTPVLSQLFAQLPYQDDDERQTRALYALAELQSLIGCLNKSELLALDLGLSESLMVLLRRLAVQHKSALGLALLDHALPVSLIVFDAAKAYYMPRIYRVLTIDKKFWAQSEGDGSFAEWAFGIERGVPIERVPFANTSVQRLYCERPTKLFTLARFGIWLPDPTQGKRLNRVRLNKVSPCDFLQRTLDLVRLGDGTCSLTEMAYNGFQCRSAHTCNLAPPGDYVLTARPGSTLSPINQFGLSKAGVRQLNCDNEGALGDGSSGWLTTRPTSECMVSPAAFEDAPETFGECLQRESGGPVVAVDRGANPWSGECAAIDCAEGKDCAPESPAESEDPTGDTNDPPGDSDGDGDDDDDHDGKKDEDNTGNSCDADCHARNLATGGKTEFLQALDKFNTDTCPGCVQAGAAGAYDGVVANLKHVQINYGVPVSGNVGQTTTNEDGSSTIDVNTAEIRTRTNERTAKDMGFASVGDCLASPVCADVAERRFQQGVSFVVTHELQHVIVDAMVGSGVIFNAAGNAYFDMFDQTFEDNHGKGPMGCSQGLGVGCSADHSLGWSWWRLLPVNHGQRSCAVDGACDDGCGPPQSKAEMCRESTDLAHAAYVERLRNICPAPRINERIAPECRFPGCFSDGLPNDPPVCRFALCDGRQEMSVDLACSCCSSCQSGPPPVATGTSPSCSGEAECRGCCIKCGVPAGQSCPFAGDAVATEVPPAWQPI